MFHSLTDIRSRGIARSATMLALAASGSILQAAPIPVAGFTTVQWFTVQPGGFGDFGTSCCDEFRPNMVLSTLGFDRLPVVNTADPEGPPLLGVGASGQIQWWTPGLTAGGDLVTATSIAIAPIPFQDFDVFPDNGAGSSNGGGAGFQTAIFSADLTLPSTFLFTFSLSADDDAFMFLNGSLFTGLGGVHADTASPTVTRLLGPGVYDLRIFYADRRAGSASLSFAAFAEPVSAPVIPEPGIWAMLISGFGMVGIAIRRRGIQAAA